MKSISIIIITLFISLFGKAQDTLISKIGEKIVCSVRSINKTEVSFNNINDPKGEVYYVKSNDLEKIKYFDGSTIQISDIQSGKFNYSKKKFVDEQVSSMIGKHADSILKTLSEDQLYDLGVSHAEKFYLSKNAGTGGIISGGIPFFLPGAISCLIISSVEPATNNLNYPDQQLFDNYSYRLGYTKKAKKLKSNAVWNNYLIGTGCWIGLLRIAGGF